MTDQLGHAAHTHRRHDLAALLRDEAEVVDDHLGQTDEVLAAQHVVLCGHTGGAVVQMADAQVLTAQRDHGRRAEAKALSTQHRRLDHVQAGLQSTVSLHAHLVAHVVATQRLVRLGQTQLPGRAGILDRRQRTGTCAAVIARDGDEVGISLGHTGSDGAHTGLGHQLDRHQRLRIDLLQVEDELCQIFDGIDVMVRRWRNQTHARPRKTQLGDHLVDLVAGQLSALTGLGALRHLDLQHFRVDQIFGGHAETAGGDLLDLGVLLGAIADRVFTTLARIGACAQAVHGDSQSLVGLGGQSTQRHAGRIKARDDGFDGFDFFDGHRRGVGHQLQQVAQR